MSVSAPEAVSSTICGAPLCGPASVRSTGVVRERVSLATLALGTLAGADLVVTLGLLKNGGREANPLFARLYEAAGPAGMIVGKLGSLAFGLGLLAYARRTKPRLAEGATWAIVALYLALLARHTWG